MSPVTADGLPEDGRLGLIPTHPCPQPIGLQPQKGPQGQQQMTQNGDGLAHLRPLYPTTLLQRPMIDFHPPSLSLPLLSLLLRPLPVMGRPVFRVPVWETVRNTRTSPKPFRCATRPSGGISTSRIGRSPCRSGFTRRLRFSRVRKNPPKEAMRFKFFKDAYQLSIRTYSGVKPRPRAFRSIS